MTTTGHVQVVQLLRFGGLADVLQALEAEGILVVVQELASLLVEALGVIAVHVGDVHSQRAVHKNRDIGNASLAGQLVQQQHQLLGASHGEGGHNDAPALGRCPIHHIRQLINYVCDIFMEAAAVGAFHDQVIGGRHDFGVADDGQIGTADVARKDQANRRRTGGIPQHQVRRSQDMAGVIGLVREVRRQSEGGVIRDGLKKRQGPLGIGHRIKRLHQAVFEPGSLAMFQAVIQELGVVFLNVGRVAQHPVAEIHGGGSGINRAGESVFRQRRQVAAMVDVRVRKDDGIHRRAGKRQMAVLVVGVFATALVKAAIQKDPLAARLQQMHGTRDSAGRTPKCELHRFSEG